MSTSVHFALPVTVDVISGLILLPPQWVTPLNCELNKPSLPSVPPLGYLSRQQGKTLRQPHGKARAANWHWRPGKLESATESGSMVTGGYPKAVYPKPGLYSLAGPQVSREFPGTDSIWGLLSRLSWPLAMPLPRPTAHAGNSESAFFAWIISLK